MKYLANCRRSFVAEDLEDENSEESVEEYGEDQEKCVYLDCWAFIPGQTDRAISLAIEAYDIHHT